ncbi:unnamed protein product [Ixodes persulcatus]
MCYICEYILVKLVYSPSCGNDVCEFHAFSSQSLICWYVSLRSYFRGNLRYTAIFGLLIKSLGLPDEGLRRAYFLTFCLFICCDPSSPFPRKHKHTRDTTLVYPSKIVTAFQGRSKIF